MFTVIMVVKLDIHIHIYMKQYVDWIYVENLSFAYSDRKREIWWKQSPQLLCDTVPSLIWPPYLLYPPLPQGLVQAGSGTAQVLAGRSHAFAFYRLYYGIINCLYSVQKHWADGCIIKAIGWQGPQCNTCIPTVVPQRPNTVVVGKMLSGKILTLSCFTRILVLRFFWQQPPLCFILNCSPISLIPCHHSAHLAPVI